MMNEKNASFEQNMTRLEQIVRTLERGEASLEDSLKLFQEGTGLVRSCGALLDKAELEVRKVMTAPDGSPVEGEFIDEE